MNKASFQNSEDDKQQIQKTAFVSGNFNVLHVGHQRLFEAALGFADRLVVGVYADKIAGATAYVPEADRLRGVQNNALVDDVFLIENSVVEEILRLKPAFVIKGREHESADNIEEAAVGQYGGKLLFTSGAPYLPLLSKIKSYDKIGPRPFDLAELGFLRRHDVDVIAINNRIKRFSDLKVCVIGDVIVDEYVECVALGMSHEDYNTVLSPASSQQFIGGAGVVARHALSLGAEVVLLSVVGDDDTGVMIDESLTGEGVVTSLIRDPQRPTTRKQRFQIENSTRFRLSYLKQSTISRAHEAALIDQFDSVADGLDLVIFSDFSYGCITQNLIGHISKSIQKSGGILAADSQSSSQLGDIARYKNMDIISPTEREARLSLRNFDDGLVEIADKIRTQIEAKNIFLSIGSEGLLVQTNVGSKGRVVTDRLPAFNRFPVDVSGAGDALLVAGAMALAVGASIWEAGVIGSIAAGIQVGRRGNIPISIHEMSKAVLS